MRHIVFRSLMLVAFSALLGPVSIASAQFLVQNPRLPDQPDNANDRIRVTTVAVYGADSGPEASYLSAPFGLVADSKGFVYILDSQQAVVKKFASDGTWVANFAGPGKAPGKLTNPRGIALASDSILVVHEDNNRSTSRFTTDGRFLERTNMELLGLRQPTLVGAAPEGLAVYVSAITDRYAHQIDLVDLGANRIIHTFEYEAITLGKAPQGMRLPPFVSVSPGGLILVSHPFEYAYRVFSCEGEHLGDMRRQFDGLMPPVVFERQGMRGVRFLSTLVAPKAFGDEWWLGYASWPTNIESGEEWVSMYERTGKAPVLEEDAILDIFDSDWNLVYSFTRDERNALFSGPGFIASDRDGFIYHYRPEGTISKLWIEVLR